MRVIDSMIYHLGPQKLYHGEAHTSADVFNIVLADSLKIAEVKAIPKTLNAVLGHRGVQGHHPVVNLY